MCSKFKSPSFLYLVVDLIFRYFAMRYHGKSINHLHLFYDVQMKYVLVCKFLSFVILWIQVTKLLDSDSFNPDPQQ